MKSTSHHFIRSIRRDTNELAAMIWLLCLATMIWLLLFGCLVWLL